MADLSTLKSKISALKAKTEPNSITPTYLGAILDDIAACLAGSGSSSSSSSDTAAMSKRLANLEDSLEDLTRDVRTLEGNISALPQSVANLSDSLEDLTRDVRAVEYNLEDVNVDIRSLEGFQATLGKPNGIASLDSNGRVPYAQLPSSIITLPQPTAASDAGGVMAVDEAHAAEATEESPDTDTTPAPEE